MTYLPTMLSGTAMAISLSNGDLINVVQSGVTRQATLAALTTFVGLQLSNTVPPLPGLIQTFDYLPTRDGVGLLTGGPTEAGYAANAASRPVMLGANGGTSGFFEPRNPTWGTDPKGGTDVYSGSYQFNADPEYAGYAGYSPFAIVNGALRIRAQTVASVTPAFASGVIENNPNGGAPYAYISGALSTRNTFSQQGGFWEITAQVPVGVATWPALWLFPVNDIHPPEVDIMEQVGGYDPPTTYRATGLLIAGNNQQAIPASADLTQGFHRYGVYITDQAIQFYLDRVAVGSPLPISTAPEVGQPFYLLMAMQIGSTISQWVPPPTASTPTPADLLIKEVSCWQMPGPVGLNLSSPSYLDSLPVGGTVAAISMTTFGTVSDLTYSIISDPDGMFAISGSNLTLKQSVPSTTKASHQVTLKGTDSQGRSRQRLFTLAVLAGNPVQANYITSQDLTSAAWTMNNATAAASNKFLETTANAQHYVNNSALIVRAAGVKTFEVFADITANLGRPWAHIQVFDSTYGSSAQAWFNVTGAVIGYSTQSGSFSNCQPLISALPNGKTRCGFKFTTDATSTGLQVLIFAANGQDQDSYTGVTTNGLILDNIYLFNTGAAVGGT